MRTQWMRTCWLANEKKCCSTAHVANYSGLTSGKERMLRCWYVIHPLHQGTMFNKVVTTAVKAACNQQISTLRFNYRGVGSSEGSYGNVKGEQGCAQCCPVVIEDNKLPLHSWLAGFSFGAAVSYQIQPHILLRYGTDLPSVERMAFKGIKQRALYMSYKRKTTWLCLASSDFMVQATSQCQYPARTWSKPFFPRKITRTKKLSDTNTWGSATHHSHKIHIAAYQLNSERTVHIYQNRLCCTEQN